MVATRALMLISWFVITVGVLKVGSRVQRTLVKARPRLPDDALPSRDTKAPSHVPSVPQSALVEQDWPTTDPAVHSFVQESTKANALTAGRGAVGFGGLIIRRLTLDMLNGYDSSLTSTCASGTHLPHQSAL